NAGNGLLMTGDGNFFLNGLITGGVTAQPNLYRFQSTTLTGTTVLTNWNNNFVSDIRIDGGYIRASQGGVLGLGAAGTAIRGSTAQGLEVRTDLANTFS